MQGIMETVFDVLYLTTVIILGVSMIKNSKGVRQFLLFGIMAVTLGAGDAFHLIPRVYALLTDGLANHAVALGIGKFITSITMTIFYILLYYVWRLRYRVQGQHTVTLSIFSLAILRILLCLCPQNQWTSATPSLFWGILRNIPFALMGVLIIKLFYQSAKEQKDDAFRYMWLTIVLSFGFYIPVVLFADVYPPVGILMIPKTMAYVWTVLIGYLDMRNQNNKERLS